MTEQQEKNDGQSVAFPEIREVPAEAPLRWLKMGWQDMLACPVASFFYGVCFVIGGYLMIFSLRDAPEYIAAVITGFVILGPFLALGLYELSAQRERGENCSLLPTLMSWRANMGHMGVFAVLLLVVYLVWARASVVVFAVFYSGELPTMGDFFRHVVMTEQMDFLLVYFAVGAVFVLIIFSISLITIPLIRDRHMDAITAAIASVRAVMINPVAMMVWSGLIALLTLIGLVTFLIGTVVVGPLLGHATWHAYREITGSSVSRDS